MVLLGPVVGPLNARMKGFEAMPFVIFVRLLRALLVLAVLQKRNEHLKFYISWQCVQNCVFFVVFWYAFGFVAYFS